MKAPSNAANGRESQQRHSVRAQSKGEGRKRNQVERSSGEEELSLHRTFIFRGHQGKVEPGAITPLMAKRALLVQPAEYENSIDHSSE